MCQRMPGPRCSRHTKDAYLKAYEELTALQNTLPQGKRLNANDTARLEKARQEFSKRERDYYASPKGLAELDHRIKTAAGNNLKRREINEILWLQETALKDAAEHTLAGKVYDRARNCDTSSSLGVELNNPDNFKPLLKSRLLEKEASNKLAFCLNNNAPQQLIYETQQQALQAKRERVRAEQTFLIRASGVPWTPDAKFHPIKNFSMSKENETYVFVPNSYFSKLSNFFPLGCYSKVIEHSQDKHHNRILKLENGDSQIVPPTQHVLVLSNS